MAIDTEEILSEDFRNFVTFRPAYDDKYDRIFNIKGFKGFFVDIE